MSAATNPTAPDGGAVSEADVERAVAAYYGWDVDDPRKLHLIRGIATDRDFGSKWRRVLEADRAATAPQPAASRAEVADAVAYWTRFAPSEFTNDGRTCVVLAHEVAGLTDRVAALTAERAAFQASAETFREIAGAVSAERDARTIPPDVAKWLEMHVCAVIVRDSEGFETQIDLERYDDSFVAALEDAMEEYPARDDEPDPCPKGDPDCETGDDGSCHDACEAPTPEAEHA